MRPVVEISKDLEKLEGETLAHHTKHWDGATKSYKFASQSPEHLELIQRQDDLTKLNDELASATKAASFGEGVEANGIAGKSGRIPTGGAFSGKTLGERFTENPLFVAGVAAKTIGPGFSLEIGDISVDQAQNLAAAKAYAAKTAYTLTTDATNAGFAPFSPRSPLVVPMAQQPLVLQDLVKTTHYEHPSVLWMEETVVDHQADEVPEGGLKPQSTYKWEDRNNPMIVVAHWVHISRQQLEDVPMMRSIIDGELTDGLKLKVQERMLNGQGGTTHIQGILTKNGIQTHARGAEDGFSAIYHSFTRIRGGTGLGFAEPDTVLLNPLNWDKLATTKDANGNFIYGGPAGPVEPRVWGKRVVSTISMAQGTGLSGDFAKWVRLWERHGIRIEVGVINDDFVRNQLVILAEIRLCQTVTKPSAFCTITASNR